MIFGRRRAKLEAMERELEEMFRRMRALEEKLGIPGQGPRPDCPERESDRYMLGRLSDLAGEIQERLGVIEGTMT